MLFVVICTRSRYRRNQLLRILSWFDLLRNACRIEWYMSKEEAFLITLFPVAELTISYVRSPFIPITTQNKSENIGSLLVDGGASDHTRSPTLNSDKVGAGDCNFLSCVYFIYACYFSWSLSEPLKRKVGISVVISGYCSNYAGDPPVAAGGVARNMCKVSGKRSRITNPCNLAARNEWLKKRWNLSI